MKIDTKIIRNALKDMGMSQTELAKRVGVSQTTICTILKTGSAKPGTIKGVLRALEIDFEEVGIEEPGRKRPGADPNCDPGKDIQSALYDLVGAVLAVHYKYGKKTTAEALKQMAISVATNPSLDKLDKSRSRGTPRFTLGDELRRIRKTKRWTISEMAEAMGVSTSTYYEWEFRNNQPNAGVLNEGLYRIGEYIPLGARRFKEVMR